MAKKSSKPARLQAKLPEDLHIWVHEYARRRNTNVTQLIKDHFTSLKEKDDARRSVHT